MEIQTLWQDGVFRPLTAVNLNRIVVTIHVPDDSIVPQERTKAKDEKSPHVNARPAKSRQVIDLLDRMARIHEAILKLPVEKLPSVTQKQMERLDAMEMREDR